MANLPCHLFNLTLLYTVTLSLVTETQAFDCVKDFVQEQWISHSKKGMTVSQVKHLPVFADLLQTDNKMWVTEGSQVFISV